MLSQAALFRDYLVKGQSRAHGCAVPGRAVRDLWRGCKSARSACRPVIYGRFHFGFKLTRCQPLAQTAGPVARAMLMTLCDSDLPDQAPLRAAHPAFRERRTGRTSGDTD